jgi:alkanesulfonate monooxygenase SsuD/methylene tetrahydromethanopterin reductase-like flavin-dependent oxidoreductase (luciferase family)
MPGPGVEEAARAGTQPTARASPPPDAGSRPGAPSPGGPPQFGLYLPQLRMSFDTILHKVEVAEALGYHSVWFMDHMAAPAAPEADTFEGWTLATAVAARTSRIRVGHLVLCDAFRHPTLLAKMAATLDVVSGGRLELGLGWGSVPDELDRYGFGAPPPARRAGRLRETLEVLEALFTGEPVSYSGPSVRLEGAVCRPTPLQRPLPLHLGGAGRHTLELARRHATFWNCPSYAADRLDELLPSVGQARVSVQHPVGLARSPRSRRATDELVRRRFGTWGGVVSGTPEEVAARLAEEQAKGVELFVLQFFDFASDETLACFAEEVVPALRKAAAAGGR